MKDACDCHAHVCGPESRYPYAANRIYTPEDASPADYRRMLDSLGMERRMLDALKEDPKRLRAVAVVPESIPAGEIEVLHRLGVRGVRCNIVDRSEGKGVLPLEGLKKLAHKIKPFGWHLEFLMHVDEFPDLDRQLAEFPVDVVFGHLGYVKTEKTISEKGFQALLRLMKDGKAWVKLTGPYRLTTKEMPYPDTDVFAQALVEGAPERLVWGTDWPHVHIKTAMPEDRKLLGLFEKWVPQPLRQKILVDNPAVLYGF
jgi:2-pyrone-4,6-dicarboxylate lactonase